MASQTQLLQQVALGLDDDEMSVLDAGFIGKALYKAGLPRFVVRLAKNFPPRRNNLPASANLGRPAEYGEIARPLA